MSKINQAIHEIQTLDQMANKNQWMNRIHPLVKLFLTILYILVVVSFPKYALSGVLSMAVYPIVMFMLGDISWKEVLYRLRVVLPLVCVVGVFNPFFDREAVAYVGTIGISGGVISMLSLMAKGVLTVLASYMLIATTSIEKICYAMRAVHIPKMFVTQILLIYRYITVLLAEAKRITQAYSLRAPGQKGIHIKVWGSLVGQLLLRSMDRADDIYESMCLRGYTGEFYYGASVGWKMQDTLVFVNWIAVFVMFRIFPVFQLIGGLFV